MGIANPYQVPRSNLDRHVQGDYSEVKSLSTKGRMGRLRYLGYSMGYSLLIYILIVALIAVTAVMKLPQEMLLGVFGVGFLAMIIVSVMLTIQRAHDFNTTGWISFLLLVPLAGMIFLFIPGTDGENRFGKRPPPNGKKILLILIPTFLAIIALIGIIAAIAIPAYQGYADKAKAAAGNNVLAPASHPE